MKIDCVEGKIVITHPSGFVSKYNRGDYEDYIEREREMLKDVQANIDEAEKMIERIDANVTPKVTE